MCKISLGNKLEMVGLYYWDVVLFGQDTPIYVLLCPLFLKTAPNLIQHICIDICMAQVKNIFACGYKVHAIPTWCSHQA